MAVHVRYNSWYISSPSSAKQLREMTKLVPQIGPFSSLYTLESQG